MQDIEKIIKNTVESTVSRLRELNLVRNNDTYRKTEELLRNYNLLSTSADPAANELAQKIENALSYIKDDPYYDVITLYYIGNRTREDLAARYGTSEATISRNKTRLVNKLKVILYPEEYAREMT